MSSPSSKPIRIASRRSQSPPQQDIYADYSPRSTIDRLPLSSQPELEREGVVCPSAFLPRESKSNQIRLDVFHHPAEIHTPSGEPEDLDESFPQGLNMDISAQAAFEATRSPVIAIHRSRGLFSPVAEDDKDLASSFSGMSVSEGTVSPPRRVSGTASETTYVPMTPLPSHCILSFFDRPREFANLMRKNTELFTLIEHALPREKYDELLNLWKTKRDVVGDEEWVKKTKEYIADGEEGGALWVRWAEIVGWDVNDEEEEDGFDWDYMPSDTTLYRRWSEVEKARGVEENQSGFTGIGVGSVGAGLSEIKEGEEDEFEEGERPVAMRVRNGGRS
jgi:hypothetical protein